MVGTVFAIPKPLILHAGIQTTMNVYGKTPGGAKKDAPLAVEGLLMPFFQAAGESLEQSNGFV